MRSRDTLTVEERVSELEDRFEDLGDQVLRVVGILKTILEERASRCDPDDDFLYNEKGFVVGRKI
jgi:hypothetical protein